MTVVNARKLMPEAVVRVAGADAVICQRGQRNYNAAGVLVKGATVKFADRGSQRYAWFPYEEMELVQEAPSR